MADAGAPASLAEALAALQGRLPHVAKDAENPHFRSRYANLEAITAALMPVLSELGLAFTAVPTMIDEGSQFVLDYQLRHVSGDAVTGFYPLPASGSPQQIGSAITYARRYALCAVTGLAPGGDDDDDDGNAAETTAQKTERRIKSADRNSAVAPGGGMTTRQLKGATGAAQRRKAEDQARATTPEQRKRRIAEERARADTAGHDPAKVTRSRGKLEVDPWETRPPEERENAPGTVNDLQVRAIWMLVKKAGYEDPDTAHALARTALGLPDDALLTEPDENGEVRETFKRLSHAQAAEFLRQLQGGSPG